MWREVRRRCRSCLPGIRAASSVDEATFHAESLEPRLLIGAAEQLGPRQLPEPAAPVGARNGASPGVECLVRPASRMPQGADAPRRSRLCSSRSRRPLRFGTRTCRLLVRLVRLTDWARTARTPSRTSSGALASASRRISTGSLTLLEYPTPHTKHRRRQSSNSDTATWRSVSRLQDPPAVRAVQVSQPLLGHPSNLPLSGVTASRGWPIR